MSTEEELNRAFEHGYEQGQYATTQDALRDIRSEYKALDMEIASLLQQLADEKTAHAETRRKLADEEGAMDLLAGVEEALEAAKVPHSGPRDGAKRSVPYWGPKERIQALQARAEQAERELAAEKWEHSKTLLASEAKDIRIAALAVALTEARNSRNWECDDDERHDIVYVGPDLNPVLAPVEPLVETTRGNEYHDQTITCHGNCCTCSVCHQHKDDCRCGERTAEGGGE